MKTDDLQDVLGTETPAPAPRKRTRTAKPNGNGAAAPAKRGAPKASTKSGTTAAAKKPSRAKTTAPAKAAEPKKVRAKPDVSMKQADDRVVLAAVRKLKEPTLASKFAITLGTHNRIMRMQLQRLAADKANGFKMYKKEANWFIANK